jgi:hypothetical protein
VDKDEHTLGVRFCKCREVVGLVRIKKDICYE